MNYHTYQRGTLIWKWDTMTMIDEEDGATINLMKWNEEEQNIYFKGIDQDDTEYAPTQGWQKALDSYQEYLAMKAIDEILLGTEETT